MFRATQRRHRLHMVATALGTPLLRTPDMAQAPLQLSGPAQGCRE